MQESVIVTPDWVAGLREWPTDDDLLLREANHRMKNTLTMLACWRRRDRLLNSPFKPDDSQDWFEERILAFGRLYNILSGGGDTGTTAATFLGELCCALTSAILEPSGIHCDVTIEDGFLSPAHYNRLGLMVTELITNAAKHAFPNRSPGTIRFNAHQVDGNWCCTVADDGIGVGLAMQGTGGRVLAALARGIGARIQVQSDHSGTAITVIVPPSPCKTIMRGAVNDRG